MEHVLIVGGGRYGTKAARFFRKRGSHITLLDPDPHTPAGPLSDELIRGDASDAYPLIESELPAWIVPTAPVHVLALILLAAFPGMRRDAAALEGVRVPRGYFHDSDGADLYISNLDSSMRCLDTCSGSLHCPVRGNQRERYLYEELEAQGLEVMRSIQLEAGLGALRGADLAELLERCAGLERIRAVTSCTCHAVVTGLVH